MDEEIIQIINQIKDVWGQETVAAIIRKIDEEGLIYDGNLRRSVMYEMVADEVKFFMAEYGKFQDQGVNPQGLSLYQTPFAFMGNVAGTAFAIKDWADAKGLNNWAVATNLQKYDGIRPKYFFNNVIEQRLQLLGDGITNAIAEYLERVTNRQQNP